jgi:hypothetical protein
VVQGRRRREYRGDWRGTLVVCGHSPTGAHWKVSVPRKGKGNEPLFGSRKWRSGILSGRSVMDDNQKVFCA